MMKLTRREALIGASTALVLPSACSTAISLNESDSAKAFSHGIASGDPDPTSVVIWTRVSGFSNPTVVGWRASTDAEMSNIVGTGRLTTDEERDYTVKVVVDELEPGRVYYYQFEVDGVRSEIGRTITLATGHLEKLTLAVVTCSNYPFGYFNGYDAIGRDEQVDLVVHLGDYIYEYGTESYGGTTGKRLGRNHEPAHEILTLDDYRQRHAQYKTDEGSRLMHARHPLIVIWDDHESANNPWMGGAQNHQDNEGPWNSRRTESLQAFYEWLPVREPGSSGSREEYWRHYKFGDLASLITLESRHTGRSKQIDIRDYISDIKTEHDVEVFRGKVIDATDRELLSSKMKSFLEAEIAESVNSDRQWRLIGSQSVIAKRNAPPLNNSYFEQLRLSLDEEARNMLDGLTRLGSLGLPLDLDSWNGYGAARENFYQICKAAGAQDLLVLAGDSHSYWQNVLYNEKDEAMGVELGSTGITSPRSLLKLGHDGLRNYDEHAAAANSEVVWTDGRYRGYIRLEIAHERAIAEFVTLTTVESRNYNTRVIRSVEIHKRDGTLSYG